MSLRILLVRHGLSSFNLEHRIQGRDDLSSLTDTGVQQALATGEALRGLSIDAAYSSPLRRAHDTAKALLAAQGSGLAPQLDDDLLEVDLSPWTGLTSSELRERFPHDHRLWYHHPEQLELQRADGSRYAPIPELMEQADATAGGVLTSEQKPLTEQAGDLVAQAQGLLSTKARRTLTDADVDALVERTLQDQTAWDWARQAMEEE